MSSATPTRLPAQRFDAEGRAHVNWWAVLALAGPLIANSAIQAALNLTDAWFVGHISALAMAGMGAVHWLVIVFIGVLGGVAMAVQTVVAQAHGAQRYARASHATWTALWASLFTAPLFAALGFGGAWILAPFELDAKVLELALQFWQPRMMGAALGVALWSVLGFFNGIGRARVTLSINLVTLSVNALLAWLFIFKFGWGVPGAAWATNCATAAGLAIALVMFVYGREFAPYRAQLTWRLNRSSLIKQFRLGLPMGIGLAADLFGFALFQLMLVKLSPTDGAASQIVMILTSLSYMPAIGIALAGTTLVGQSIGAGDKAWARRLGNTVVVMAVVYMGSVGLLLGLASGWSIPLFLDRADPLSAQVAQAGIVLMWLAAAYQLFDGMILGASFCLRGAGDATVPAVLILGMSWFLFVPLAHSLAFAPGQGFVDWLPQFGYGAAGGWMAAVVYVSLVGVVMLARWRSRAWERMVVR